MEHMAEYYATGFDRIEDLSKKKPVLPVLNNLQYARRLKKITPEEDNAPREKQTENEIPTGYTGNTSDRIFANVTKFQHEEYQYLNLIENIIENGFWEEGRNGRTKSIFIMVY